MTPEWIADFERINQNALTRDWLVSPLEYGWGDGKSMFDRIFSGPSKPDPKFDDLVVAEIFRSSMQVDFRAKMIVYAFMRERVSKLYGFEIENGLLHLYGLDFLSCISQWMLVVEGYCRRLFGVKSAKNARISSWKCAKTGVNIVDNTVSSLVRVLSKYCNDIMFKGTEDFSLSRLNRHVLLHGNVQNKSFFSQKNCLLLMFVLDTLVFIEMSLSKGIPLRFEAVAGDVDRLERRKAVYLRELCCALSDEGIQRANVLKEHLAI